MISKTLLYKDGITQNKSDTNYVTLSVALRLAKNGSLVLKIVKL